MVNIYGSKSTQLFKLPTIVKTVIETQDQRPRELWVQQETINSIKWKIDQQGADKTVTKARMDVVKEVCEQRKKSGKAMK